MKENSEVKPVKLRLKINFVGYPARAEGFVNMIKITAFDLTKKMKKYAVMVAGTNAQPQQLGDSQLLERVG